jgi:hypothetical protein
MDARYTIRRAQLLEECQVAPEVFEQVMRLALVGFQGRGFADGVQLDFCHSLFLEVLIFQ